MKHGLIQGSVLGPLLHIMYKLSSFNTDTLSQPIIYADDSSAIISSKSVDNFCTVSNTAFYNMSNLVYC
jgi:hypothetical protein